MGLRAASVRHPNAVVMAPALTEAGQSQNFTLPPSSPINSVSQNGEYVTHEGETKKELKQIKCSYPGDSIINVTTNYLNIETKKKASSLRTLQVASDINQQLNIIMNTCPTSMGDQQDTMGLQKTGMDPMATLLKDKTIPNEMEQLLNNLDTDIGGTGDIIPQNVEDLMQAFKTIESGAGDRSQGDGESEAMFPIQFDRELFSEVDMINMCEEENLNPPVNKELRAKEMLEELSKKQLKLERRSEFLLRRLRKIQSRTMGQHVSAEVAGLFEYIHRTLRQVKDSDLGEGAEGVEFPVKPIGTRNVNNLVRKLHLSAIQQSSSSRQKHISKYFGSGSVETTTTSGALGSMCVPRFPEETRDELERVAGALQTELSVVEQQVDSDATASSSGAESCDEMQTYNNPHQNFLSINKRAAWRYANERAAVAARWTWLQAQISDLEYRIRQHNELHRQIRASKGAIALGEQSLASAPASPSAVNGYRGQLPGALGPGKEEPVANGAAVISSSGGNGSSSSSSSIGCARTRPLNRNVFRKRKLLQTTGLHTVSKKASRPSNIRCGCVAPLVPCALCTGRTDPTFPRDLPDHLTVPERVALLDPGFHPVLSFPDDISQSIHLEAIMKLPDWQQKSLRYNMKSLKGLAKIDRADKMGTSLENRPKKAEHRKKYNRLLKNDIKSMKGRGRRLSRGASGGVVRVRRKRHTASMAMAQLHALASESTDELEAMETTTKSGSGESLTPSPLSHVHVVPYRRSRVDSYDIDNIVIPYSVAAATRVEKLQYKEILTPKWRVIDSDFPAKYDVQNNGIVRRISEDSDMEDISEETAVTRHEKCEHEEKKKFLSYIKFPLSVGRSRANRRTDSRAESSGANTPDPMSPAAHVAPADSETAGIVTMVAAPSTAPTPAPAPTLNSPVTSPPATPLSNHNHHDETSTTSTMSRRRTVSSQRCPTPELIFTEAVLPYDTRTFPLTETEYDTMLKSMPEGHPQPPPIKPVYFRKQSSRDSDIAESPFPGYSSRPESPASDSTESVVAEEDPNDPEWEGCRKS